MNKKWTIFTLAGLMALANACKKDPVPGDNPTPGPTSDTITPIVPGDTITPVDTIVPTPPTPGDTIQPENWDTIPGRKVDLWVGIWMPESGNQGIRYPTKDTIRFYANHPGCDTIFIKWYVPPNMTSGWTPDVFRFLRDSLKVRFAMSDKIVGEGKIYVNKNYGGASIPCEDSLNFLRLGMTKCDSAVFAGWGFEPYVKYSKSQRDANVKSLDTIGMQRAILGGKQR